MSDMYALSLIVNEEFRDTPRADRAAERILASDWLAQVKATARAEALLDAARAWDTDSHWGEVTDWLRDRARSLGGDR